MPENGGKTLEIEGRSVALFRLGGKFYAMQNHCLHRGGPLGEGHVEDGQVTCPWHAWQFDVKTGRCSTMPGAQQQTFKTKVEKGEIWIEI